MIQIITPDEKLKESKARIENFVTQIPELIFEAAVITEDAVQDRVEGQGLAANGSFLDTTSLHRDGRYSFQHGTQRRAKGLSTGKVDLSFTGQMWDSWTEERQGNQTGVGFNNEEARHKAEMNEQLYGVSIFTPSEQEKQKAIQFMKDKIKNMFKG